MVVFAKNVADAAFKHSLKVLRRGPVSDVRFEAVARVCPKFALPCGDTSVKERFSDMAFRSFAS
jgi:hypothetical protein